MAHFNWNAYWYFSVPPQSAVILNGRGEVVARKVLRDDGSLGSGIGGYPDTSSAQVVQLQPLSEMSTLVRELALVYSLNVTNNQCWQFSLYFSGLCFRSWHVMCLALPPRPVCLGGWMAVWSTTTLRRSPLESPGTRWGWEASLGTTQTPSSHASAQTPRTTTTPSQFHNRSNSTVSHSPISFVLEDLSCPKGYT